MSRVRIIIILACILLVVIGAAAVRRNLKPQTPKGPAPNARGVPVLAEPAAARDVPVYLRGLLARSRFRFKFSG